ncbi:MAG: sugar phosphate nucleotidyltransferase [Bacteroidota bacterium]
MTKHLLILAGGASSRMKASTAVEGLSSAEIEAANQVSKALIEFGPDKRPILDFLLRSAEKAGFTHIILIVGTPYDRFQFYYGNQTSGNRYGKLSISYAIQHIPEGRAKPFGTADAVLQAMEQYPYLKEVSFCVCNCDNLYSPAALRALVTTSAKNAFIAYDREGLLHSEDRIARFALAVLDQENNLEGIIEKPESHEIEAYRDSEGKLRVSMNIFKFHGPEMYPYLRDCPPHPNRDEKELPTAILLFCEDHPFHFNGIPFHEHVPDLTSKEDIPIMKQYIKTHFGD